MPSGLVNSYQDTKKSANLTLKALREQEATGGVVASPLASFGATVTQTGTIDDVDKHALRASQSILNVDHNSSGSGVVVGSQNDPIAYAGGNPNFNEATGQYTVNLGASTKPQYQKPANNAPLSSGAAGSQTDPIAYAGGDPNFNEASPSLSTGPTTPAKTTKHHIRGGVPVSSNPTQEHSALASQVSAAVSTNPAHTQNSGTSGNNGAYGGGMSSTNSDALVGGIGGTGVASVTPNPVDPQKPNAGSGFSGWGTKSGA